MKRVAILLTCFNRKDKTVRCLQSLEEAFMLHKEKLQVESYLVDDGCTDGTAAAAISALKVIPLHIIKGTGNLFWAGGMRLAWNEALKRRNEWDYYLLINDDVEFLPNVIDELLFANNFAIEKTGKEGICSGLTCATSDPNKITYGGGQWKNRILASTKVMEYNGQPQFCDFSNANILLVPRYVVNEMGIFYEGYHHGKADYDYTCMARKNDIPVVLTAHACGVCDNDHVKYAKISKKVVSMTLKERKAFYKKPINSIHDYLLLVRRTSPFRYPLVALGRAMNVYCPKLYYRMKGIRYD